MRRLFKGILIVLVVLGGLAAGFFFGFAPFRAERSAAANAQFRVDHQAAHDAVDAKFNQQDKLVNGISWHYVDEGSPNGKVILFLHGLPEGWYSWSKVLPLVDHSYRLIAIDMKGYGRSTAADDDYNWHTVAAQTLDLMTSLGINQFYLVSHDWGTIIGSVMAVDHPERILGYVRMEADLIQRKSSMLEMYAKKPQWLLFQSYFIGKYMMEDGAWFIDFVYSQRMATPFQAADRDYLVYEFSRPDAALTLPKYFLQKNWDLDAAIGKICQTRLPFKVLQLQADGDPSQPPSIFAEVPVECPSVQLEWVKNANHFDNFDQPEQVAQAINRFIKP